jgi:hypothetical protein
MSDGSHYFGPMVRPNIVRWETKGREDGPGGLMTPLAAHSHNPRTSHMAPHPKSSTTSQYYHPGDQAFNTGVLGGHSRPKGPCDYWAHLDNSGSSPIL